MTSPDPIRLSRRILSAIVLIALMPVAWILGLDQAIWLGIAYLIGLQMRISTRNRTVAFAFFAFILIVGISGFLGAEGTRWLTFARETLIVIGFAAVVLSMGGGNTSDREATAVLVALLAFVALSSAASLVAFVAQESFRFTTIIAPLVPDTIARTGLGFQSLSERSLAEESYFLGAIFYRPQGLFLFSTSQAVAQAIAIPLFLVAARRKSGFAPSAALGATLCGAALIVSTTRAPVLALLGSTVLGWLIYRYSIGNITIVIPLRGRRSLATVAAVVVLISAMWYGGLATPILDFLTTRSLAGRNALYEMTVERWFGKPLLGWGTEVDWTPKPSPSTTPTPTPLPSPSASPSPTPSPSAVAPPDQPPLGSHSLYLGILFKEGIVGLAIFAAAMWSVARKAVSLLRIATLPEAAVVVAFATSAFAAATESLWLDPATALIVAVSWGLVLRTHAASRDTRLVAIEKGSACT